MVTTICLKEKPRGNDPFLLYLSERKKKEREKLVCSRAPIVSVAPEKNRSRNEKNAKQSIFLPFLYENKHSNTFVPKKTISQRE